MPRAITPSVRKASNIRGKIVTKSILIDSVRKIHDDPFGLDVDLRADRRRERNVVLFSVAALNAQQNAAATLVDFDHFAAIAAVVVDEPQSDEIVQEVFILIELARLRLR